MGDFNSKEFSFSDVKVKLLGLELTGLRGLTYKKKQEKEAVYGAGNQPKSIQRGNVSHDGTLMVLKSDFDLLNEAAIAAGYDDLVDVPGKDIIITCVYENKASSLLKTVTLIGVDITEDEDGMKQGDKFKEVTLPFIYLRRIMA